MAKWYAPLVTLGLFALVGCQPAAPQQQSAVVRNMPAPNFGGPSLQDSPRDSVVSMSPTETLRPAPAPTHAAPAPAPHVATLHNGIPADWQPVAAANHWRWIVIHHSATSTGGAAAFDKMHRAKGWDELGYHFVVGNGTDTRDGQVEVGSRWPKQKWGAHAKTPSEEYNKFGIGICLVGNFDVDHPTQQQVKNLTRLVSYLMATYHIPADHVLGHRDTKSTDCPGRNVNIATIRRLSTQMLAEAGIPVTPDDAPTALARGGEMLVDEPQKKTR